MSPIGIWFWYSTLCGFGFASVFRGSRAEALRKHHGRNTCPNNGTPCRCPHKVQAQDKRTKLAKEKGQKESKWRPNRPKWKELKPTTTRNLENVAALWSRKQKLRKQGRGSSRKGYRLNVCRGSWRCGRGRMAEAVAEAVNNFLSTTKEKRTKLKWQGLETTLFPSFSSRKDLKFT